MRFRKDITAYFLQETSTENLIAIDTLKLPQTTTQPAAQPAPAPIAFPEPVAIPAPRAQVNPDEPIAQLDPDALPPENVDWKAATSTNDQATIASTNTPNRPSVATPPYFPEGIVVSPEQTQAREAAPELGPAKTPRLLTGTLIREINVEGAYPVRLQSPEGRLIAYVDFSKIYISDLSPYLKQKVYIRGQIFPLPKKHSQLVILAESLKLAP